MNNFSSRCSTFSAYASFSSLFLFKSKTHQEIICELIVLIHMQDVCDFHYILRKSSKLISYGKRLIRNFSADQRKNSQRKIKVKSVGRHHHCQVSTLKMSCDFEYFQDIWRALNIFSEIFSWILMDYYVPFRSTPSGKAHKSLPWKWQVGLHTWNIRISIKCLEIIFRLFFMRKFFM